MKAHGAKAELYTIEQLRNLEIFVCKCFEKFDTDAVKIFADGGPKSESYLAYLAFLSFDKEEDNLAMYVALGDLAHVPHDSWEQQVCKIVPELLSVATLSVNLKEKLRVLFTAAEDVDKNKDLIAISGTDTSPSVSVPTSVKEKRTKYIFINENKTLVVEALRSIEEEIFAFLVTTIPLYLTSQQYVLWRSSKRGHGMAVAAHEALEDDISKQNKRRQNRPQHETIEEEPPGALKIMGSFRNTFGKLIPGDNDKPLFSSITATTSIPGPYSDSLPSLPPQRPDLVNTRVHCCDTLLGVLVHALHDLPIGLALHKVDQMSDSLSVFPFEYVNPYYEGHCGGFTIDDMKGCNHDFMYLQHERQYPTEKNPDTVYDFSYCSSANIPLLAGALDKLKTVVTIIPMRKCVSPEEAAEPGGHGYVNVLAWKPFFAGPPILQDSTGFSESFINTEVKHKPAVAGFTWSSLNPFKGHAKTHVETVEQAPSFSASSSNSNESELDGLSNVGKKFQMEVEFYACLQISIPVKHISFGLTASESQAVAAAVKKLNILIPLLPNLIDPHRFHMFNPHKSK